MKTMTNDFETVINYLTNNKQDKIIFHRHKLIYIKNNIKTDINTTNWTNTECQTLIKELNKQYNNKDSWKPTTNKKLKELGMI